MSRVVCKYIYKNDPLQHHYISFFLKWYIQVQVSKKCIMMKLFVMGQDVVSFQLFLSFCVFTC